MARKFSLPLAPPGTPAPTIDAMRARLGGREVSEAGLGAGLRFVARDGVAREGVLLFARGPVRVVLTADGAAHALDEGSRVEPLAAVSDATLRARGASLERFEALAEGDRVRATLRGQRVDGRLLEKCRYGALVLRDDGAVLAVGFAALEALAPSTAN